MIICFIIRLSAAEEIIKHEVKATIELSHLIRLNRESFWSFYMYLTARCFEDMSLTSPGKRSPGSKITMSPGTISL